MQLDPDRLWQLLLACLPALVTLLLVALGLAAAHYLLIARRDARAPSGQVTRQLVMLGLTVVGLVAVILALPLGSERQGQLLSLLGLLLSGAIALSSTNLLGNLMSGIMLRAVGNFKMGDFLEVGQEFGRVSERGLFHVELQTPLRQFTSLPYTYLVNTPVRVLSATGTVVDAKVSIGYDVPHGDVEDALVAAAEAAGLEEPFVRILELGDYAVTYQVAGLLRDIDKILTTRSRIRTHMLDSLHGAGIEIVSPAFVNRRDTPLDRILAPTPRAATQAARDEAPAEVFDKASSAALKERLEELARRLSAEIEKLEGLEKNGDAAGDPEDVARQLAQMRRHLERVKLALEEQAPAE